jgi:hypothetical protein
MWPHKKRNRRVFAWISDTHGGKKTGLLNPDTVLIRVSDKGEEELWKPEPSITQRWLWSTYENAISNLADFVGDNDLLVAHCGDITHGDKYDGCIPDITRADQRTIAVDNFLPLISLPQCKRVRLVTGTEVHVPDQAEARIAGRLREKTGVDIATTHHARFTVGQEVIDGAHHGPYPGSRDWLEGNVAFYYVKDRVYKDRRAGKSPARVYMRGHYHLYCHVSLHERWEGECHGAELIIIPALSGQDSFIKKVGKSPPIVQAGIVALEFVNGRLNDIVPFIEDNDLRTEETL